MSDESGKTISFLSKIGNVITPAGVCILLLLQTQFVSRKEFTDSQDKIDGRVESVEKILVQMAEANKVNDRQEAELTDHERRIRSLEHLEVAK